MNKLALIGLLYWFSGSYWVYSGLIGFIGGYSGSVRFIRVSTTENVFHLEDIFVQPQISFLPIP